VQRISTRRFTVGSTISPSRWDSHPAVEAFTERTKNGRPGPGPSPLTKEEAESEVEREPEANLVVGALEAGLG